jgi:hypothetical protein
MRTGVFQAGADLSCVVLDVCGCVNCPPVHPLEHLVIIVAQVVNGLARVLTHGSIRTPTHCKQQL